jgi:mannose-6-phosphate isomerase-like protein (cupin superfamily)
MARIVNKPWGYEYIAYQTQSVAVKVLHIKAHERTSLHCHPNKSTGLVVVRGQAIINFIADQSVLTAPAKKMIRRGLFHQTIALTDVVMLEIETPVDQDDLVRLSDNYGRADSGYEKYTHVSENDCLEIITKRGNINTYSLGSCIIDAGYVEDFDLDSLEDSSIVMMLRGGLAKSIDGRKHHVIQPGDVGQLAVMRKVIKQMDGFDSDTTIMVIK